MRAFGDTTVANSLVIRAVMAIPRAAALVCLSSSSSSSSSGLLRVLSGVHVTIWGVVPTYNSIPLHDHPLSDSPRPFQPLLPTGTSDTGHWRSNVTRSSSSSNDIVPHGESQAASVCSNLSSNPSNCSFSHHTSSRPIPQSTSTSSSNSTSRSSNFWSSNSSTSSRGSSRIGSSNWPDRLRLLPSVRAFNSAKGVPISLEYREKERAQAALAKQYGVAADVGSDSTAAREAHAPDNTATADAGSGGSSGATGSTTSSSQSSAARRLGLDLPQSGVGPSLENVAHAKEVRKAAGAGEGVNPEAGLAPGIVDVPHETKE
ncbi:hypothetical protein CLOM_g6658 [Closterium sp. NIES-68]|nr:hypothetical protein CLOM_g6658 [Closterium sp. NIES-68]